MPDLQWNAERIPGEIRQVRLRGQISEPYAVSRDGEVPSGIRVQVNDALYQLYRKLWREGLTPVSWKMSLEPSLQGFVADFEMTAEVVRNGRTPEVIVRAALGLPLEGD